MPEGVLFEFQEQSHYINLKMKAEGFMKKRGSITEEKKADETREEEKSSGSLGSEAERSSTRGGKCTIETRGSRRRKKK